MANLDISRHLLDLGKRYTGARMQQGRSLLDSDWNEDARLEAENLRLKLVELVGPQGSSNSGFAISGIHSKDVCTFDDGQIVASYDFSIRAGSMFVGGLRLQCDPTSFVQTCCAPATATLTAGRTSPEFEGTLSAAVTDAPAATIPCACGGATATASIPSTTTSATASIPSTTVSLPAGSATTATTFGGLPTATLSISAKGERFLAQVDWLQIDRSAANLPTRPVFADMLPAQLKDGNVRFPAVGPIQIPSRCDLVYLEAWEQPVTAVEDGELRERGLGGPDSSARIRRMRRIHVAADVGEDVPEPALAAVMAALEAEGVGSFDAAQGEFVSGARLTVTAIADSSDLCTPTPPAGYIGHEDQAIRVELRDKNAIIWGFDNGAPLYRVKVGPGGRRLTFLGQPRDPSLRPQFNQLVELIPWGSRLPNLEKAAALTGELRRVAEAYDPATGELLLDAPLPVSMLAWLDAHCEHRNPHDGEQGRYLYLRLWDRGGDLDSPDTLRAVEPLALGHTGLQLQLSGQGRPGDFWIIAARRATAQSVQPWQLSDHPPIGPRRFYAPLAVVCWEIPLRLMTKAERLTYPQDQIRALTISDTYEAVWGPLRPRVLDGRRPLKKLCAGGCGEITVGDGAISEGMVNSLSDAIALVADGGRIRLLAGQHQVEATLTGRKRITIVGCGARTVLVNANPVGLGTTIDHQGAPTLILIDCEDIVLRDFAIQSFAAVGIELRNAGDRCRNITLERLSIACQGNYVSGTYALPQAAVLARGVAGLTVRDCHVTVANILNYTPALVLGGTGLRVQQNRIEAGDVEAGLADAMGGVQILSHSVDVRVDDNLIRGGWGHGVALGHMIERKSGTTFTIDEAAAWSQYTRTLGDVISSLRGWGPAGTTPTTIGSPYFWTPAGPVVDVHVCNNRVRGMGLSGVSTGGFTDMEDSEGPRFIVAIDLEITGNELIDNVQIENLPLAGFAHFCTAVGGVALAAVMNLRVQQNRICNNYNRANTGGSAWTTPIVGVAVVAGQGVVIEDNQILGNGLAYDTPNSPLAAPGLRGGVVIGEVSGIRGYTFDDAITAVTVERPSWTLRSHDHALIVRKNQVSHPVGKALWVLRGFGPIVVAENSLHGLGDPVTDPIGNSEIGYMKGSLDYTLPAQGACVQISNYGHRPDLTSAHIASQPRTALVDSGKTIAGGDISFVANEVELDWEWSGGYCSSVLLSSLDSACVSNNLMVAAMASSFTPDPEDPDPADSQLLTGLPGTTSTMSFLFAHCWVGAPRMVRASGNRFEEARYDCLFSCLIRHAADLDGTAASSGYTLTTSDSLLAANVGSHCMFPADGDNAVSQSNVVIYQSISGCTGTVLATQTAGVQTVYIQNP